MGGVLTRDDVTVLLARQQAAYELLLWLGRTSADDPTLLDSDAVGELAHARTAAAWLARHLTRIPADLAPERMDGPFAELFASFLTTSFRIEHVHFDGRLVATYLVRGATPGPVPRAGLAACQTLALKHLLVAEGASLAPGDVGGLARRSDLAEALGLWTYVWELDRRSRGKGKGPLVHALWRRLPREARQDLSTARLWAARERLLVAARQEAPAGQAGETNSVASQA